MSYIEKAIKDAANGGFMKRQELLSLSNDSSEPHARFRSLATTGESIYVVALATIFLDPLFWKALGKARGWSDYAVCQQHGMAECFRVNCWSGYAREYLYHWHRFIDYLATGRDAESFFEQTLHTKE